MTRNEKARLWADFNDTFGDLHGAVGNFLEVDTDPDPDFNTVPDGMRFQVGDLVRVYDGEGLECLGVVVQIEGSVLTVDLDEAGWSRAGGHGTPFATTNTATNGFFNYFR